MLPQFLNALPLPFCKGFTINKCLVVTMLAFSFLYVFTTTVYSQPNITRVEYYIDNDPGFGKATPITISAGTDIANLNIAINPTTITEGVHRLYVRALNANGNWSLTNALLFYKPYSGGTIPPAPAPASNISRVEYYLDNDPGFGVATPLTFTAGTDIQNSLIAIDPASISEGVHRLYVRAKNANGNWSLTNTLLFYKPYGGGTIPPAPPPPSNISRVEYYLDTDPGFGAATPLSFTAGTDIQNSVIAIDPAAITEGVHRLYVRAKNANGNWSLTNTLLFYKPYGNGVVPPAPVLAKLNKLEYYIDTDPGFGNGVPVSFQPGTNISDLTIPVDISGLAIGNYTLYVRAKDSTGAWSLTNRWAFKVDSVKQRSFSVGKIPSKLCAGSEVLVPVKVDVPFGVGNIFTAQLSNNVGNFSNPVNIGTLKGTVSDTIKATIPANASIGDNYRVRVIASTPADTTAYNDTPLNINRAPEQNFTIVGNSTTCPGSQDYSISNVQQGVIYTWNLSGGGTIDTVGSLAKINWVTPGSFLLQVTGSNSCGTGQTASLQITVFKGTPAAIPTITVNGRLLSASSPSSTGNVSGFQWYKNSSIIANATGQNYNAAEDGQYTVRYTNPCGVGPESAPVIVSTKKNQTIAFDSIPDITYSDTIFVVRAVASSGLPVSYSIISGPATIVSDTLTITGAGLIQIRATQPGNDTLNAAFADVTFTVNKAVATITLSDLIKVYNGSPQSPTVTTNPPGLLVSLLYDSSNTTPVNAGSYHVIATINDANYSGSDTGTFVIQNITAPDITVQSITSDKTVVAPNEVVVLSWKVANVGQGQSSVNWTERIYMQSSAGHNRTLLKQFVFVNNDVLPAGKTISRSEEVNIPTQLNIGDQGVFVVELVPGSTIQEVSGGADNNVGIQQASWSIRKLLTVELSPTQIPEGSDEEITAIVNRTGSLSNPLTVSIKLDHPERFTFPTTVTIPAGQAGISFTISAPDNDAVEGPLSDSLRITAASFQAAKVKLTILDNDKPSLSIIKLTAQALEGQTVTFKVTTNLAPTQPLQVYLTSNNQARFPVPSSVTIAAGDISSDVTVKLEQDSIPEVDLGVSITAGASNHNPADATIQTKDDDMPGLQLIVQTNIISESAGFFATQATIRRTGQSNSIAFTANLSADLANTLILPGTISLAAGENEKSFTIGVVDNSLVDGQRQISITASIFVNSCGCSAPPASSGSVSAAITVSDNDGPALQLTAAQLTLAEGGANAGLLRITRNTATNKALSVSLSSSDTSEATIPATTLIPIGQTFIDVPITTINDGVADGNQQVYFQASAGGFSPGSVWVLVSDLNKPDLQISTVKLPNASVQAMSIFNYQFSVKNTGFATAPTGVLVRGYLSLNSIIDDKDTLITEDILSEAIPSGQTVQIQNAVKAPDLPGQYKLLFWVNPDLSLTELLATNNTSASVNLTIKPDYTATANVQLPYFLKGTTIEITGSAVRSNGTPAANAQVEVYVITNGLRRKYLATTNGAGHYTTEFIPLAREAGHYIAGASFPGMGATEEQDAFDILGVRINEGEIPQFQVILNDTLKGSLAVQNMSNKSLTNFTLNPVSLPGGAYIRFDTIPVFAGNDTIKLAYTVVGSALSPGRDFEVASLQVIANEGSVQKEDVFYFCQAPNAYVVADVSKINTSVSQSKGERLVEIRLVNKGVGSTGSVTINLPQVNWLSSVTPKVLPSMSTGDTAIVILKFLPLQEVPFDFPVTGSIGIATQNGNSFRIPFSFEKVSQSAGAVKVTVTNQFTYYTDGSPKINGAHVQIKNYFSNELYAEGSTDSTGIFTAAGIPEGKHRIIVEKDKHLPYNSTITIDPGDTVESTAFLNYQAITFSWSVVPTAVQDQYDITLEAQFETNVPIPVVTIEMPKTMPQLSGGEVYAFSATLTNHGLITAKDVALNLPQNDPEYEFATNYVPADLLAQQSIQVPVVMRRRSAQFVSNTSSSSASIAGISQFLGMKASQYNAMADQSLNCKDFVSVVYWYTCNISTGLWERGGTLFTYTGRVCSGNGGGGGGVDPNIWALYQNAFPTCAICPDPSIWEGDKDWTNPFVFEKKSCVDCIKDIAEAVVSCTGVPIPKAVKAAYCVYKAWKNGSGIGKYVECIPGLIPKPIKCVKKVVGALTSCLNTEVADERKNLYEFGSAQVQNSQNPPLGAAFQEISKNLEVVVNAFDSRENWAREYFGTLLLTDAWDVLSPKLEPFIVNLDSIHPDVQAKILAEMAGYEIQPTTLKAFFSRWNTSLAAKTQGVLQPNADYPEIINWTLVKTYSDSMLIASNYALDKGYESVYDMYEQEYASLNEIIDGQKNEVCASVKVQLSQRLTMTREAFEGTLDIFNGHPTDAMDSLSVHIQITDMEGVPGNGVFEIQTKSLTNLSDVTGTGNIAAQQNGTVKFLFIPEHGAAPTVPKEYNFGGYVRYWDPYAEAMVTLPLAAVPLTVNPSPNLMLHYFMERNILGDDALTMPEIEPSVPAELAVMVENQGYGPAVNMTISSAQPKIIENEKGLAINFSLIGSNFQGQPKKLGVTDINFGTIPALQTHIGQWYFTSSLLGKFVSYEANVVHANSFGNPELSLVKGVKLHELTKSIRLYGELEDGINDFLVNDIFDVHDAPDIIYFSQGSRTEKVYLATTGRFSSPVSPPTFTNTLTVTASDTGWNYIKLDDPGNRQYDIVSVIRSDGQLIPLNNAWLTFVTLPVSRPPVYENKFHFVDSFASLEAVTYTIIWKPRNFDVPKVVSITGAPEQVTSDQVKKLRVLFDKHIDPATFTYEDLVLTFQGGPNLSDKSMVITQIDTATFDVDISKITTGNGFYAFTAQAANVTDIYGISGLSGKQVTWSQFLVVPTVQAFQGIPEGNTASAYDTIQVLFNLPIDLSSVTPERFIIVKDSVQQKGTVIIDSVRADKKLFYLSGLKNILTEDGAYEFIVDLPKIKSANNVFGLQTQSVTLTVDNTGPLVLRLERSNTGGLDSQHVTFVNMQFDEDVVGFNTASIQLTRNGEVLPLNIAQLSHLDSNSWMAGNFGMLTYLEGDYTFKVNLGDVKDAAGNKGSGSKQVSWTVNRSALITITKMAITPDLGFSNNDGVTFGGSLNVAFNLSASASLVTVSQVDLSGEIVLKNVSNVSAGDVSLPVTLITGGNIEIKVTATGMNGGVGTAEKTLFVDQTALSAEWLFAANQSVIRQVDTIGISFSSKLLSNKAFLSAIQFRRNGFMVSTDRLSFKMLNDTVYNVYGLRKASSLPGIYELRFNLESVSKYNSGKAGVGQVTVSWTVLSTNQAPIAKAGTDLTITAPGIFTLNGSASSDPDSDSITYRWIAPSGVVLSDSTSGTPSFNITAANQDSSYSFLLIVSDGELFTTDVVDVVVNLTAPPLVNVVISCPFGLSYTAPGRIKINASVTDADSIVKKVQFYNGSTLLHTETVFPYSYFWINVPAGNYTLTAKAIDSSGKVTTSNSIRVSIVPNTPPTASITTPTNNATFGAGAYIKINATASDADGTISKVDFYNGTTLLHTETVVPYGYQWKNIPAGNYTLTVKATDNSGLVTTSAPVNITVVPNIAPTVNITNPANNQTIAGPATISLQAVAKDADGKITTVEFFNGTTLLRIEYKFPYTFVWKNVPVGNYSITAKAIDNLGAVTTSAVVNISVVPNKAPTVSIINPADNESFTAPATIPLNASAQDPDGTISRVEFYNGGTLLNTQYKSPYSHVMKDVPAGTYTITAKAIDNLGLSATSAPITVTVAAPNTIVSSKPAFADNKAAVTLKAWPNPASEVLNIFTKGLQQNKQTTLSVISASGTVMKTMQSNSSPQTVQLDVSSLVRGVYTIKVICGDKVMYKQFMKL